MTPEQYQTLRARSSLSLITALRPLTRLLRPRPSPAQWQAWVQSAYPAVYRARVEQWEHAQRFYLEERARFGATDPTPVPMRDYAPQALDTGLQDRNVLSRLDALEDDDPVPNVIVDDTLAVAERHGAAAGRDAIVDAARHDRRALGYARTTTGLENCAFCLMLVSRGPVYKDEDTALLRDGTGEPYHDHCDCIAVPVYDRGDWPGRDEYLEMEAAWQEHGGDLLHWRRYVEDRVQPEAGPPAT